MPELYIFNHRREHYCCLCNQTLPSHEINIGHSIGKLAQVYLYKHHQIVCHSIYDKICPLCKLQPLSSLVNTLKVDPGNINIRRMHQNLIDLTSSLIINKTMRYNPYNLNDRCYLDLVGMSGQQLNQICHIIMAQMNMQNINIKATISSLQQRKVDEDHSKYIVYGNISLNYSPENENKIHEILFQFYQKCRVCNSFRVQGHHNKYSDKTIRKFFHCGIILLSQYFKNQFYGFHHLSRSEILKKTHIFLNTVNSFVSPPITISADGQHQSTTKSLNFNASYNTYSLKDFTQSRKSMPFVLYVIPAIFAIFAFVYDYVFILRFYTKHRFIYRPTAYIMQEAAGFNCNKFHNDAKILLFILQQNLYNINNLFPKKLNGWLLDKGYGELLWKMETWSLINCWFPSFISIAPIPTLDSNLSRICCTWLRWAPESWIGHGKSDWTILCEKLPPLRKLYIDEVRHVLHATTNFLHPDGRVQEMDNHINQSINNYFKWILKGPRLFRNPLEEIMNDIETRPERWVQLQDKHLLMLFPEFINIAKMGEVELISLCGGHYCYKIAYRYIHHNDYGSTITFYINESQFDYVGWEQATRLNQLRQSLHGGNAALLEYYQERQIAINQEARAKCEDEYFLLRIHGCLSRHGRSNERKTRKRYNQYFCWHNEHRVNGEPATTITNVLPDDDESDDDNSVATVDGVPLNANNVHLHPIYREIVNDKILETHPNGLKNIGVTCYLNSCVQILFRIYPLRECINVHSSRFAANTLCRALNTTFTLIKSGLSNVIPHPVLKWLNKNHPSEQWQNNEKDAALLLDTIFLPQIVKEIRTVCENSSDIYCNDHFITILEDKVSVFSHAKICRSNNGGDYDILYSLPVHCNELNLDSSVHLYINNVLSTTNNDRYGVGQIHAMIAETGQWICVNIKRFTDNNKKDQTPYQFEEELDLNAYIHDGFGDAHDVNKNPIYYHKDGLGENVFYLKCVLCHIGVAAHGHYIVYCKYGANWWEINDSALKVVDWFTVQRAYGDNKNTTPTATFLVYTRDEKRRFIFQEIPFFPSTSTQSPTITTSSPVSSPENMYFSDSPSLSDSSETHSFGIEASRISKVLVNGWIREFFTNDIETDNEFYLYPPWYIIQVITHFVEGTWNYCNAEEYDVAEITFTTSTITNALESCLYCLYNMWGLRESLIENVKKLPVNSLSFMIGKLFKNIKISFTKYNNYNLIQKWIEKDLQWQFDEGTSFNNLFERIMQTIYDELNDWSMDKQHICIIQRYYTFELDALCVKSLNGSRTTRKDVGAPMENQFFLNVNVYDGDLNKSLNIMFGKPTHHDHECTIWNIVHSLPIYLFVNIQRLTGCLQQYIFPAKLDLNDILYNPYGTLYSLGRRQYNYLLHAVVIRNEMDEWAYSYLQRVEDDHWILFNGTNISMVNKTYYKKLYGVTHSNTAMAVFLIYVRKNAMDSKAITTQIPIAYTNKTGTDPTKSTPNKPTPNQPNTATQTQSNLASMLPALSPMEISVDNIQSLCDKSWNCLHFDDNVQQIKGIYNSGLICYINVGLLILNCIDGITHSLIEYAYLFTNKQISGVLADFFYQMKTGTAHAIGSELVVKWLANNHGDTNWSGTQNDAILTLTDIFIHSLIEEIENITKKEEHMAFNKHLIIGQQNKLTIYETGDKQFANESDDNFTNISVRADSKDLNVALNMNYLQIMAKKYCHINGDGETYEVIKSLPIWLGIHIHRFGPNGKIYDKFEYPINLNMNKYVYNENGWGQNSNGVYDAFPNNHIYIYKLSGIVVHRGTINAGHYMYIQVNDKNEWYLIDNHNVHSIPSDYYTTTFGGNTMGNHAVYLLYHQIKHKQQKLILSDINTLELQTVQLDSTQIDEADIDEDNIPTLEFEEYGGSSIMVQRQREDWKRMINMKKVMALEVDEDQITNGMKSLLTACDCGHGLRTAGMCGHRGFALIFLHNLINKNQMADPHPLSTKVANTRTNVEPYFGFIEKDKDLTEDQVIQQFE